MTNNLTKVSNYDLIVVGTGFCGAIIARKLVDAGKRVLMLERREHIAGNMYDEIANHEICVQRYGPHIFHTDDEDVYDFVSGFGEWFDFPVKYPVEVDGKIVPQPFNFQSIEMLFEDKAETIIEHLKKAYPTVDSVTVVELLESEDIVCRELAEALFEKDYRPYTSKQWGIPPEEIDPMVLKRVPIRLGYEDVHFPDKHQMLPVGGFSSLFKKLLEHDGIDVLVGVDALDLFTVDTSEKSIRVKDGITKIVGRDLSGDISEVELDIDLIDIPLVFTGAIDELLEYKYGMLPYRTLDIVYEDDSAGLPAPIVAYPQADGFTRKTDYGKFTQSLAGDVCYGVREQGAEGQEDSRLRGNGRTTVVATEYPLQYDEIARSRGLDPYYPIINDGNQIAYNQYLEDLKGIDNLVLCGRLAEYTYYNMDQAVARALCVVEELLNE
ncbi:MAG: NAD(P)-binding protein [Clostridiales Family XIII bacterium]|jgi:UDP-galactopyranose mutase|nr:NAD(P)-binding protein [Clostridiales Family XIII bacterium]